MSNRTSTGLEIEVRKDFYLGLWNIKYVGGGTYAGPYKTKKEATERLRKIVAEEREPRTAAGSLD